MKEPHGEGCRLPHPQPKSQNTTTIPIAVILGMLMIYSITLLTLGFSLPVTIGAATAISGVAAELVRRVRRADDSLPRPAAVQTSMASSSSTEPDEE